MKNYNDGKISKKQVFNKYNNKHNITYQMT